jgi:hypothetical protein
MNRLIETISKYIEARIELVKVDVQQGIAKTLVNGIQFGLIGLLGFFTLTFICLGLAHVFNSLTNSSYWGYFIMAGVFLLILAAVQAMKKTIQIKMEKVASNMFHKDAQATKEVGATAEEVVDQNESLGRPSAYGQANTVPSAYGPINTVRQPDISQSDGVGQPKTY